MTFRTLRDLVASLDTSDAVLSIRNCFEMIGVYTFDVVAQMVNNQSFRNWAVDERVRNPVTFK